jgi:hypothetical protein
MACTLNVEFQGPNKWMREQNKELVQFQTPHIGLLAKSSFSHKTHVASQAKPTQAEHAAAYQQS